MTALQAYKLLSSRSAFPRHFKNPPDKSSAKMWEILKTGYVQKRDNSLRSALKFGSVKRF